MADSRNPCPWRRGRALARPRRTQAGMDWKMPKSGSFAVLVKATISPDPSAASGNQKYGSASGRQQGATRTAQARINDQKLSAPSGGFLPRDKGDSASSAG